MATDKNRNLWTANYYSNSVSEVDSNGNVLSPSTGYTDPSFYVPSAIAVDGDGYVWVANVFRSILKLDSNGQSLSGPAGYGDSNINNPRQMAIDASGNI